jgi:hypothetical protein
MNCKVTGIKEIHHWHKNRHIGQILEPLKTKPGNIESLDIKPCIYNQLMSDRRMKIQWRKLSLWTNGAGKIGYPHAKE